MKCTIGPRGKLCVLAHTIPVSLKSSSKHWWQEGPPVAVCYCKALTEDTLLSHDSLMKRMLRIALNVLDFLRLIHHRHMTHSEQICHLW